MHQAKLACLLITSAVLGSITQQPNAQNVFQAEGNPGVIQGTVTYDDGKPVSGATVYSPPMDRPSYGPAPRAKTDEAGHFAIIHLWLGKFSVTVEKLDEDYLGTTEQFYSDGKFETATLTSQNPTATVNLHLGPKAGILTGTAADAVTGAPLTPCVEFRRAKKPNNYLTESGLVKAKYRLLIPPNTDVLIKIWYEGYSPWYYPGTKDKAQARSVNLKPGEETKLDIRLEPDPTRIPDPTCPTSLIKP
jgi:hypothetical protein